MMVEGGVDVGRGGTTRSVRRQVGDQAGADQAYQAASRSSGSAIQHAAKLQASASRVRQFQLEQRLAELDRLGVLDQDPPDHARVVGL